MKNLMRWLDRPVWQRFLLAYAACAVTAILIGLVVFACSKIPHDFGRHNDLKTICHVWKGDDGFRYQATQHINSSENTHGSHPWDYDGECEE